MRHHPHRPDCIYVLIAGTIATLIIAACMTAAVAITLALNGAI